MNICATSLQIPPMLPLMHMHEGLLSSWCSFWQNGSSWPWNRPGSLQKFGRLTSFSFKQIWVDLHQTMLLDRQGSYTRPVLGLVRCVCKDETEQTGRSSPIKMRISNLHFFAPIWMAQSIVHNFRRMSMAELKPKQPRFFDYKGRLV